MSRRKPCPDPGNYVWVDTKDGGYWRAKRGTKKKAKLNKKLLSNKIAMKLCSPLSKKLKEELLPYLDGLKTGRLLSRLNGLFIQSMNQKGAIDYSYLKDFDFQADRPIYELMDGPINVKKNGQKLVVEIDVVNEPVRKLNSLVSDYYFDAILIYGDIRKVLVLESKSSQLYAFDLRKEEKCKFDFKVPKGENWILIMKVSCLEGEVKAINSRHYGMKVIATG